MGGALFFHVEAECGGMQCPPYDPEKELTCVVCTIIIIDSKLNMLNLCGIISIKRKILLCKQKPA